MINIKKKHFYRVDGSTIIMTSSDILDYIESARDNGAEDHHIKDSIEISKDNKVWTKL